ncbi:MAG: alpha/beta hydrolase [Candidatus Tectomicrobia bacterium]|nr:alpha/beta hydrolase [Candidatus Tectomicrobia bacterium]
MAEGTKRADYFMYFPENYRWSGGMLLGIGSSRYGGGEIGEIDRVGKRLRGSLGDDEAWFREWKLMGEHVERLGDEEDAKGHRLTAAGCYLRACNYYQIGERYRQPKDEDALETYRRAVASFQKAMTRVSRPKVEVVEIPFEGTSLPAYFVHAEETTSARPPAVIFFDGLDVTKEIQYFQGVPDLVQRGMSCLIVDGPGNGESIRFRGLYLRHDYEKPASAAVDYLQSRPDVDPDRIGIMAVSLGGYYAPRAAAFEKRLKACVAWGAIYNYHETWKRRIEKAFATALSVPGDHIKWVMGAETFEEALKKLEPFTLEGVARHIECPFLLTHGEADQQVPLEDAQNLFNEVGSSKKTFKMFTIEEGGAQHCQGDNRTLGASYIFDWLADTLQAR